MISQHTGIHCSTLEDAIKLVNYLYGKGLRWCDGTSLKDNSAWEVYKENTVYSLTKFNEVIVIPVNRLPALINRISFEDFCKENDITSEHTLDDMFEELKSLKASKELMSDLKNIILKYNDRK